MDSEAGFVVDSGVLATEKWGSFPLLMFSLKLFHFVHLFSLIRKDLS